MKNEMKRKDRTSGEIDGLTINRSTEFMPSPHSAFK